MLTEPFRCPYCDSPRLYRKYSGAYHKIKADHGPFDFYECTECKSGLTCPPPSASELTSLYGFYSKYAPGTGHSDRSNAVLRPWFRQCVERAFKLSKIDPGSRLTWCDVGAGLGGLSEMLQDQLPNSAGMAVDLHHKPGALSLRGENKWIQCDLNQDDFAAGLGEADIVFSISVWEHVTGVRHFLKNLLRVVKNRKGCVYVVCPQYGSFAQVLLGRKWPFFIPGEHLYMPTKLGARLCVQHVLGEPEFADSPVDIQVRSIGLPYAMSYYLSHFRMNYLAQFVPERMAIPFPVGVLEMFLRYK